MQTLSEFLKSKENQVVALEKIIFLLRREGVWGSHGLFAKIGNQTGISPAYVGRALTGKNRLTDNFVEIMAAYLGAPVKFLRGETNNLLDDFFMTRRQQDIIETATISKSVGFDAVDKYLDMMKETWNHEEFAKELGVSLDELSEEFTLTESKYEADDKDSGEILDVRTRVFTMKGELLAADSFSKPRLPKSPIAK